MPTSARHPGRFKRWDGPPRDVETLELVAFLDGVDRDLHVDVVRSDRDPRSGFALLLPGIGGTLASYRPLIEALTSGGLAVAMPRFALEDPRPVLDVLRVLHELEARTDARLGGCLGVVGHSLGTLHLVEALSGAGCFQLPPVALISASDVATSAERADRLDARNSLLIVHSRGDLLCAYSRARRLYEVARGSRSLVTLDGSDHAAGLSPTSSTPARGLVPRLVVEFLESARAGSACALPRSRALLEATGLGRLESAPRAASGHLGRPANRTKLHRLDPERRSDDTK